MRDHGLLKNTLIIVVADHGESLYEEGFLGHGHTLNEVQTRIPLIFSVPGLRLEEPVGQEELFPIVVAILNGTAPGTVHSAQPKTILQVVGSLRRPVLVGIVGKNETRTVLDTRSRVVTFVDQQESLSFDEAWKSERFGQRVRDLLYKWESKLWIERL